MCSSSRVSSVQLQGQGGKHLPLPTPTAWLQLSALRTSEPVSLCPLSHHHKKAQAPGCPSLIPHMLIPEWLHIFQWDPTSHFSTETLPVPSYFLISWTTPSWASSLNFRSSCALLRTHVNGASLSLSALVPSGRAQGEQGGLTAISESSLQVLPKSYAIRLHHPLTFITVTIYQFQTVPPPFIISAPSCHFLQLLFLYHSVGMFICTSMSLTLVL